MGVVVIIWNWIKFNAMKRYSLSLINAVLLIQAVAAWLIFNGCGQTEPMIPQKNILVKIGDRIITTDEFIRRSEYSIRPPYCRQDNYIHRKIVLNSLIAEKLLALEAGGNNELLASTEFQDYIKGRREQAMRQVYFSKMAWEKADPDSEEVKKLYALAGRKYRVQYLRLPNETTAARFRQMYQEEGIPFDELAADILGGAPPPQREIRYNDDLSAEYQDIFYSGPLEKNQLLGPIRNPDGSCMIMKVDGWTTQLAMSDQEMQRRYQDVHDNIKIRSANRIYAQEVGRLMQGKTLELQEAVFFQLAECLAPAYLKSLKDKKEAFNQGFWGSNTEVELDTLWDCSIDNIRMKPLLTFDGKVWTVADLERAIQSHPLVFRERRISRREFPEQLKLAIADLLRDLQINIAAYSAGYDKLPEVRNYTVMWQENLLSIYQRDRYLEKAGALNEFGKNYQNVINTILNPYIDSLQAKYSKIIRINTDAFEKIKLTNIDLFAIQSDVPYPIVSPSFPILTTDNKLDYGSRLVVQD